MAIDTTTNNQCGHKLVIIIVIITIAYQRRWHEGRCRPAPLRTTHRMSTVADSRM